MLDRDTVHTITKAHDAARVAGLEDARAPARSEVANEWTVLENTKEGLDAVVRLAESLIGRLPFRDRKKATAELDAAIGETVKAGLVVSNEKTRARHISAVGRDRRVDVK